jgi:hypothetical protein
MVVLDYFLATTAKYIHLTYIKIMFVLPTICPMLFGRQMSTVTHCSLLIDNLNIVVLL